MPRPGALSAGTLVLALAGPAFAHSLLFESGPAAGSIGAAPGTLTLRFNNRIEKALSRLKLTNERGETPHQRQSSRTRCVGSS